MGSLPAVFLWRLVSFVICFEKTSDVVFVLVAGLPLLRLTLTFGMCINDEEADSSRAFKYFACSGLANINLASSI